MARSSSRCRSEGAIRISKCSPPQKQRTRLRVPIVGQAQFVETGHLVYSFLGNLMAVRFDPDEHAIQGVPIAVAKGIQTSTDSGRWAVPASPCREQGRWRGCAPAQTTRKAGSSASSGTEKSRLCRRCRTYLQTPRLSPDGRRLAVVARSGVMTREIRVLDAARPGSHRTRRFRAATTSHLRGWTTAV